MASLIKKRNIALCIVLSIITCGIYGLYWLANLADDINILSERTDGISGSMVVVLSIATCGIYCWFWLYKSGEKLSGLRPSHQGMTSNLGILYLILNAFGLTIISYALVQSELNGYASPPTQNSQEKNKKDLKRPTRYLRWPFKPA